ncbi:dicarboxylate/amino acid:cation symporter [Parabacteroides sp. Marseille-P3160]|uniref:dicarboxylate/amino acid:cation symporter n=1 Tax=Parabacteroides sp. Marseille-P3160 TaxID=1917887 RepID=UPI0009BAFAB7|nr:dicarboxylate/amino acid:cation symporter [Parabacteroides sp. Marseille-P3160]
MKLHWLILISLILGAFTGIFLPGLSQYISWIGDLFLNALSMIVIPLIFCSVVTSIIGIQSSRFNLKKIGVRAISFYILTMLLAITTGLILVNIIKPGEGIIIDNALKSQPQLQEPSFIEMIVGIIPKNMFDAFTQNYTLPIILIAFLIALNVPKLENKYQQLFNDIFQGGLELMLKITHVIIRFSPIGIFSIIVKQFSGTSDVVSLIHNMMLYVLTVAIGLTIHMFVWLPLILRIGFRVNPIKHFQNMLTPILTAFSTASSSAALPASLYAVEQKDGVSKELTNFSIPFGSAINMDGAALLECVATLFIAQAYGIELSFSHQILVALTVMMCTTGAAGIPMAALVMMTVVLNAVGLPLEGIGLIVGIDRILDMMRSAVNVYSDTCVAVMIAKSEKETLPIDIKATT